MYFLFLGFGNQHTRKACSVHDHVCVRLWAVCAHVAPAACARSLVCLHSKQSDYLKLVMMLLFISRKLSLVLRTAKADGKICRYLFMDQCISQLKFCPDNDATWKNQGIIYVIRIFASRPSTMGICILLVTWVRVHCLGNMNVWPTLAEIL